MINSAYKYLCNMASILFRLLYICTILVQYWCQYWIFHWSNIVTRFKHGTIPKLAQMRNQTWPNLGNNIGPILVQYLMLWGSPHTAHALRLTTNPNFPPTFSLLKKKPHEVTT